MHLHTGQILLPLARAAIARELGRPSEPIDQPQWLREPGASFITLRQGERLRGCIGSLKAHRPLGEDVEANAVAAAFRDPRFKPLTPEELDATRIEVSLLSALEPLQFADEHDALSQ
ncbi:MAG: hypothetical protein JWM26_196, partial [Betaproteobacteria bacterium]|nr:hypothetical protein [Betaproteobacteria bacterium]